MPLESRLVALAQAVGADIRRTGLTPAHSNVNAANQPFKAGYEYSLYLGSGTRPMPSLAEVGDRFSIINQDGSWASGTLGISIPAGVQVWNQGRSLTGPIVLNTNRAQRIEFVCFYKHPGPIHQWSMHIT